jgi:general secretion pathway protein F
VSAINPNFRVRYVRLGDSKVHNEVMHGPDEEALRSQLRSEGLTVLSLKPQNNAHRWHFPVKHRREISSNAYVLFCKEVKTLLHAGMTVVEAVDTLAAKAQLDAGRGQGSFRKGPFSHSENLASLLLSGLQKGQALSLALSDLPQTPPVLVAAVRAGERTSNLMEALDDYLRFDLLIATLRKKIVSAAIYPALVTGVGISISLFLLLVVMPNFANMYESVRSSAAGGISGGAAFTVDLTRLLGKNRAAVFSVLLCIAVTSVLWITSGSAKRQAMGLARRVPWVRERMGDFELAMMYQALALLMKGGYAMTEALQVAADSALSPRLSHALTAARNRIEQGGAVSQAFANAGLCDEVGRRLMGAAERNGEFHLAADVVSRMHGERFELFVERLTRIVEPLLLLAVALLVGGIVILMYMPVFDMATQLL